MAGLGAPVKEGEVRLSASLVKFVSQHFLLNYIIMLLTLDIIYSNPKHLSPLYELAGVDLLVFLGIPLGSVVLGFGCHFWSFSKGSA